MSIQHAVNSQNYMSKDREALTTNWVEYFIVPNNFIEGHNEEEEEER
jgi:hypothetical protein